MQRKRFLLVCLFLLLSVSVFAVDAYFIPLGSAFYDIVDDLYILQGLARPSTARPYSNAQAELVLSRIDRSSLSGYALTLYDKASEYVEKTVRWQFSDGFGLGAYLSLNPELYAHTNTEDFRSEEDWLYSYDDRQRFLYLGLEFSVGSYFYTYADLMYTMGRYSADGIETKTNKDFSSGIGAILPVDDKSYTIVTGSKQYYSAFSTNFPPTSAEFEFEWPKRAFVAFGGKSWSLLVGRDRINWGSSKVANFIIDSHVGYHDMTRLTFFTDKFSYEWTNLFFETRGTGSETTETGIRMLMAHRLEFRPFSWLDFAVSENVMYQASTLSFQYLNPGFIYHNLNNRSMFNAIASLEINITPLKGWELYAQFVLDQARAPNENDSQADAWGFLVGTEMFFPPFDNGVLSFNLEFNYTTPLLYRRDGVDFLMYQRSVTSESYPLKLYYIGYKYGGDVILLHLGVDYDSYDRFSISFTLEGMVKGEMTMFTSHSTSGDNSDKPNYKESTPSGTDIQGILMATIGGTYEIPYLPSWLDMSISSSLSYVGSVEFNKSTYETCDAKADIQFSFGLSIRL